MTGSSRLGSPGRKELPTRARVVVVGGGIAGCSVLHHLARRGWTDTLLLEKGELTSGSTWHAAGLCTQFHSSGPMTRLLMRSVEIYRELEAEGDGVGLRQVGSVRLATRPERVDEIRAHAGIASTVGLPFEIIGPREVQELFPLAETGGVISAAYLPTDGYVDPSAVTHAFANRARSAGATVRTQLAVRGFTRLAGGWLVHTESGDVECEHVVNCAGMWARQVGAMAGVRLPVVPLEHHYVVTDTLAQVVELDRELPVLRDPDGSFYVRAEGSSLLVGPFEPNTKPWSVHGVANDFEGRLLPGNLDRILPVLLEASRRVPSLEDAGLRNIINGPDGYTPDGLCLMGEVAERTGFHVLAGFSIFGIVFGAGAGDHLAQWIVEGRPDESMWDLDVRRFGSYADALTHRVPRALEVYAREYAIHYEDEEFESGRPLKTGALYDRLNRRGAVFGERFGWERPLWFARGDDARRDLPSLRIPLWHERVAAECRAVRSGVGVLDQGSFAKFDVRGPDAERHLRRLCANRLPTERGRLVLTQMLNEHGGIECDVTVARVGADAFYVVSAAACEGRDLAWIREQVQSGDQVTVDNVTARYGVLTLAGPDSRDVVSRLAEDDIGRESLPFFHHALHELGGVPTRVMRLSYVGELGFELHHPVELSRALYEAILSAGEDLDLIDFGYRALESMRLEKGYRLWGKDILPVHSPLQAGLERFVDWEHDFIGREPLERERAFGVSRRLVTLAVDASRRDTYPHQYDPVRYGGEVVAQVAAGGFGHVVDRGIALAYLPAELAVTGTQVQVGMVGELSPARVSEEPLFDPANERIRS